MTRAGSLVPGWIQVMSVVKGAERGYKTQATQQRNRGKFCGAKNNETKKNKEGSREG